MCYALPGRASVLTILPPFVNANFRLEPRIPTAMEACYAAAKTRNTMIGVPTPGNGGGVRASPAPTRTELLFHYSRLHGRAVPLRRRIEQLVRSQGLMGAAMPAGQQPPPQSFFADAYQRATFVLLPTGDYPLRDSSWRALRSLAIPVFFASCPTTVLMTGYPLFLPSEPAPRFGRNKWAVLLNQTELMLNDKYLERELRAISEPALEAMRGCLAKHAERMSYGTERSASDAVSTLVKHMLAPHDRRLLAEC